MNTPRPKRRARNASIVIVLILVCGAIVIAVNASFASRRFDSQYAAFIRAEESYKAAAMKPAAEDNPLRKEIGFLLAQAIQVNMSPAERIEVAKKGIADLNELEIQIDAIKDEGDAVAPLLDALEETANSVQTLTGKEAMKEIVTLGRENARIISDIRGLSYRADYYTGEVFERVIDEQGAMSNEHITYLNNLIPQLEEQFNLRQNLYTKLAQNTARIKQIAAELAHTTRE